MSFATNGGQNKSDLFGIVDSGTAYAAKQLDYTTAATSAANKILRLDLIVDSPISIQADGTIQVAFDQDSCEPAFFTALDTVAAPPVSGSSSVSERVYQDGTKNFGETGTGQPLVLMNLYLNYDDDASHIFVYTAIGTVDPTSGSSKHNATNSTAPTFLFKSIIADYDFEAKTLLDTAIVTTPSSHEISEGKGFVRAYVAVAV